MSAEPTVDPITREVVQNRLVSVVREMSHALARAAYSPIIYEVRDFSNVLVRPNGALVAQAEGIPVFLGAMSPALTAIFDRFTLDSMRPGDVFASNDPYAGNGTHKPDVNIVHPIFHDGEIVLFAINKAHWTDIGGKNPGSWSPDATNTYQEGVCIPPVRLYAEGAVNADLWEIILANTRMRENNEGDLLAQLGACRVAEQRVHELIDEYGWDVLDRTIDSLIDYAEAMARAEIARIPDGVYRAEDWVDSDGVLDEPFRIAVTVTVAGDEMTFDFTECPPQRYGGCGNATWASSHSAAKVAYKCATLPHAITNEGSYRPLKIVTQPGTVVHPHSPAPVTAWGDIGRAIIEAVLDAIGQADPSRGIGGFYGNVDALAIAGTDPRSGHEYIHFSPYAGGWGARQELDGINALCPIINGDNANVPCEVIENRYPLRVERYELIEGSGGAGRRRGGLGVRTDYRVLGHEATISGSLDRYLFNPPGRSGGAPGARSGLFVVINGEGERPAHKCSGLVVPEGAVVSHRTGGGGGYGDPRERDPEMVASDLEDGYVLRDQAACAYGFHPTATGA